MSRRESLERVVRRESVEKELERLSEEMPDETSY
jgi:hypothetical protein